MTRTKVHALKLCPALIPASQDTSLFNHSNIAKYISKVIACDVR